MNLKIFKLLISLIIVFFATNSCKKGHDLNPAVDLNGVFVAASSMNLSDVQMYTMNGQVSNQDVIKAFITSHSVTDYFIMGAQSIPYITNNLQINFKNNTLATISGSNSNGSPYSLEFTIVQRSATGFIVEAIDTISTLKSNYNNRAETLSENANKINGFSNCIPLDPATGYNASRCSYREAWPFIIKDGDLYLSLLSLGVVSHDGSATSGAYVHTTGTFNPDITKQLINGDTLIVQPQLLLFTKQ